VRLFNAKIWCAGSSALTTAVVRPTIFPVPTTCPAPLRFLLVNIVIEGDGAEQLLSYQPFQRTQFRGGKSILFAFDNLDRFGVQAFPGNRLRNHLEPVPRGSI